MGFRDSETSGRGQGCGRRNLDLASSDDGGSRCLGAEKPCLQGLKGQV